MKLSEEHSIRQLGRLELLAKQAVEGFIIGLHKSPFHGFSVEFAEHRLYNQGESTRNIDWKVFARTDKMFTKRFEEETNLRCQIVLDVSSSMYFPENAEGKNKMYYSALAAASLMNLLMRQRDAFGLTLFDNDLRLHTRCKSNTTHYRLLLSQLDQFLNKPEHNKTTAAAAALHQVADAIHKRSMVIIFTDMFGQSNLDEFFSAILHLKHNKHEVVLFHVVDKAKELDFEFENRPYIFIDMETGERLRLQPNQLKVRYQEEMIRFMNEVRMKCLQYHIDFVEVDIEHGYKPVLQAYLVKRSKMNV